MDRDAMTLTQQIADLQERVARLEKLCELEKPCDVDTNGLCPHLEPTKAKWNPEEGETYWYVTSGGSIGADFWRRGPLLESLYEIGNYFKTREEAEAKAHEVAKVFKEGA